MRGIYLCALCESLPDRMIKLRTNFSRAKLIVKRIFLTIQSHNLKSYKVLKSQKLSNLHNFILAKIYNTTVIGMHDCNIFLNYCTVYSYYSLCEYLVVLSNIAFHTIQLLDISTDVYITVAVPSSIKYN